MKEMNYSNENIRELLHDDIYKGYHYYILSLGTHPTAYIEIPKKDKLYKVFYMDIDNIDVHGGLTYSEDHLRTSESTIMNGWFIGWDYAHCYDYAGYYTEDEFLAKDTKKWTTKEIKEECKNVIEQIIKINKE